MTLAEEIRNRALRLLARRPHSLWQLRRKLLRRYPPDEVAPVLDYLQEAGVLDDQQVALERARFGRLQRNWGNARVRADLRRLGIDAKMIDSALAHLEQESSQRQALEAAVRAWVARKGSPDTVAKLGKLSGHCQRRGFPSELVREVLEPFWSEVEW